MALRSHTHCRPVTLAGAVVLASLLSTGCVVPKAPAPDYSPAPPPVVNPPQRDDGAIYSPATNRFFFEDIRARRVGDVINVVLEEATNATKSASTNANKGSSIGLPAPILFGGEVTFGGRDILSSEISSARDFSGSADSSQSNRLTGSIAVTVAAVLPNGNLRIRGQKVLTLNQGTEIVQLTGLVRAADVTPDNTIRSTQIADANITYGGRGLLADSNQPGWLTRFFHSPIWPF